MCSMRPHNLRWAHKQPLNPYIGVPGKGGQHELCYMFQRKGNDELRV